MNLTDYPQRVRELLRGGVQAGIWGDDTYPNGTPVLLVASVHEFGVPSKGIPETAWFRTTVEVKKESWVDLMQRLAVRAVNAMRPMDWDALGRVMVADFRAALEAAGLKQSGLLIESVRYEVIK